MSQTLNIGTVIHCGRSRLMIVGYNIIEVDERVGLAYLVVPCPLGFISPESLMLVSANDVDEVETYGYIGADVPAFCSAMDELREGGASLPFEDYVQALNGLAYEAVGASSDSEEE